MIDHKQAAKILIALSKKKFLSTEERESILAAVGVLAWTSLAQSRMKLIKEKRRNIKK